MSRIVLSSFVAIAAFIVSHGALADPRLKARAAFPSPQETLPPPAETPRPSAAAPPTEVRPPYAAYSAQDVQWSAPEAVRPEAPLTRDSGSKHKRHRISDEWMLSLEAVTHAPLDIGFQLGFEAWPLRLSGGYGRVPGGYLGLVTRAAGNASGADPLATALITDGFKGGYTWRVQGGIRPFRKLGLYLDAGYTRVALSGSLDSSAVPAAGALGVQGGYSVDAVLHMWLLELGYQAHIGDHVVLAVGAGVMGTFAAHTTVNTKAGSKRLPPVDASTTSSVDHLLVKHGYLPTLTLRAGFDLI